MALGYVKWFNNAKGFGFVAQYDAPEGTPDFFAHYSQIQMDGYRSLNPRDWIQFEPLITPKGPQALAIRKIEAPENAVIPNFENEKKEKPH